jgi:hypothetical protein
MSVPRSLNKVSRQEKLATTEDAEDAEESFRSDPP